MSLALRGCAGRSFASGSEAGLPTNGYLSNTIVHAIASRSWWTPGRPRPPNVHDQLPKIKLGAEFKGGLQIAQGCRTAAPGHREHPQAVTKI
jgi:hypothetical protein